MSITDLDTDNTELAAAIILLTESGYLVTRMSKTAEDIAASWNQLYGRDEGTGIELLRPNPADIHLDTVAHGLANEGRFGGHTRVFVPVAVHCIRGSYEFPNPVEAIEFMFHDAAEALGLRDLSRKLTQLPEMIFYRTLVDRMMTAVALRFGLREGFWKTPTITAVDDMMLHLEQRDYLAPPPYDRRWGFWEGRLPSGQASTYHHTIRPELAKRLWLLRLEELALAAGRLDLQTMARDILLLDMRADDVDVRMSVFPIGEHR